MQKQRLWVYQDGENLKLSQEEPPEHQKAYINAFESERPEEMEVLPALGLVYSPASDVFYPIYVRRQDRILA